MRARRYGVPQNEVDPGDDVMLDETTVVRFRPSLEKRGLTKGSFDEIQVKTTTSPLPSLGRGHNFPLVHSPPASPPARRCQLPEPWPNSIYSNLRTFEPFAVLSYGYPLIYSARRPSAGASADNM
jgi:hypothetical protein